jgi:RNA polymerase sigma factor (sigma-70 family)
MGRPEVPADFAAAFPNLFPRARSVAYRILGNPTEAEDAAAEALCRTLVAWRRVGPLPYREAWVLRVAANVAVDLRRRRRPAPAAQEAIPSAEEATAVRLALAAALAALPRRQREAVVLQHLVGLPQDEVAAAMGVSVGSVKRHGHRGLDGLRERLGPEWRGVRGVAI